MNLGHDTVWALGTVVELANTRPHAAADDGLADLSDLEALIVRREVVEPGPLAASDLHDVRRLREKLHAVFPAPDLPSATAIVNALVAEARTTPRLTDHDDWPLHLHYYAPGARLGERLAAECGMALAFLLAAGEWERLATCAAPNCERVLVDLSRNRSRRYCDSRICGNRLHVAAYRARNRPA